MDLPGFGLALQGFGGFGEVLGGFGGLPVPQKAPRSWCVTQGAAAQPGSAQGSANPWVAWLQQYSAQQQQPSASERAFQEQLLQLQQPSSAQPPSAAAAAQWVQAQQQQQYAAWAQQAQQPLAIACGDGRDGR